MEEREDLVPESEATPAPDTAPEKDDHCEAESAATTALPEEPALEAAPDWSFGAEAPAPVQTGGMGRFFCIFGAVIALCAALLIATLFLGENGIRLYRTITHERTVFVKQDGAGENGLLAPEEAAALITKSTVTVMVRTETGVGHGTGFIYSADGYICTNHHVVNDAVTVQVVFYDGECVDATVVGGDAAADVAVLKVNKTGLTPVKLGSSAATLVGESVVIVGTPLDLAYANTATFGRISATNRILMLSDGSSTVTTRMRVLQTDAGVNFGNSGGPMANMYGEVIGIVVRKETVINRVSESGVAQTYPVEDIGFAIPIDGARIIIDAIINNGEFTGENPVATGRTLMGLTGRGLLGGYWYSSLTEGEYQVSETEVEGYVYMPMDGVYVTVAESANVRGKIQAGDMITKINGRNMYTIYDVIDIVNSHEAGDVLTVTVMRPAGADYTHCEELTFEITLYGEDLSKGE